MRTARESARRFTQRGSCPPRGAKMLGLGDAPDLTGGGARRASASSFQPLGDTQSLMGGGRAAAADPLEDSDMNTDELGMGLDAILGGEAVVGGGDAGDDAADKKKKKKKSKEKEKTKKDKTKKDKDKDKSRRPRRARAIFLHTCPRAPLFGVSLSVTVRRVHRARASQHRPGVWQTARLQEARPRRRRTRRARRWWRDEPRLERLLPRRAGRRVRPQRSTRAEPAGVGRRRQQVGRLGESAFTSRRERERDTG